MRQGKIMKDSRQKIGTDEEEFYMLEVELYCAGNTSMEFNLHSEMKIKRRAATEKCDVIETSRIMKTESEMSRLIKVGFCRK